MQINCWGNPCPQAKRILANGHLTLGYSLVEERLYAFLPKKIVQLDTSSLNSKKLNIKDIYDCSIIESRLLLMKSDIIEIWEKNLNHKLAVLEGFDKEKVEKSKLLQLTPHQIVTGFNVKEHGKADFQSVLKIWNIESQICVASKAFGEKIIALDFFNKEKMQIAILFKDYLNVYECVNNDLVLKFSSITFKGIHFTCFCVNRETICLGTDSGETRIYEFADQALKIVGEKTCHQAGSITSIRKTDNGTKVVFGTAEGSFGILEMSTGKCLCLSKASEKPLFDLIEMPGNFVALVCEDEVMLLDLEKQAITSKLSRDYQIRDVFVLPEANKVIVGNSDCSVDEWSFGPISDEKPAKPKKSLFGSLFKK